MKRSTVNCLMLIDDDEATNFYNRIIIEEAGFADVVKELQSACKAYEYLEKSLQSDTDNKDYPCPSLVFLDLNMPAMNGWEFLAKYRKLDKTKRASIVIIMLTTSSLKEDIKKVNEMDDIAGIENKPLTPEILQRVKEKYFTVYADNQKL